MSDQPPLLAGTGVVTILDAVAAEDRGLDLVGARVDESGYENLVVRTADGWIIRFPRREEPDFAREVAVLARLDGQLTVPVPQVAWTGRRHRAMAYRALDGAVFDPDAYQAADSRVRNRLAASLARFLAVMHVALGPEEITRLRIPPLDVPAQVATVREQIDRVPTDLREPVERLADDVERIWSRETATAPVLLHNDFHLLNMVLTGPAGELSGVWDFSCVRTGPAVWDLRYFARVPAAVPAEVRTDLLNRVADQYARTGIHLDVAAAQLAMALEDLVDALGTGRHAAIATALGTFAD